MSWRARTAPTPKSHTVPKSTFSFRIHNVHFDRYSSICIPALISWIKKYKNSDCLTQCVTTWRTSLKKDWWLSFLHTLLLRVTFPNTYEERDASPVLSRKKSFSPSAKRPFCCWHLRYCRRRLAPGNCQHFASWCIPHTVKAIIIVDTWCSNLRDLSSATGLTLHLRDHFLCKLYYIMKGKYENWENTQGPGPWAFQENLQH